MDETRTYTTSQTLSEDEWKALERYAKMKGQTFQEYLNWYFGYGLLKAMREGEIYEAFNYDNENDNEK